MAKKGMKSRKRREQTIAISIVLAVVLIVTAVILIFIANKNDSLGSGDHNHDHDHEYEVAINLKVSLEAGEQDMHYASVQKFKQEVEDRSEGEITVTICGSNELGSDLNVLESIVREEELAEILITDVSNLVQLDARMDISSMPFLFEGYDEASHFMNGQIQSDIASELLKKNVNVLTYYTDGFEYLISNKAVSKPADLMGLFIATKDEGYTSKTIKFFNAKPVMMSESAVYQAVQNNECNAYMGKFENMTQYYLYEKLKFVTMTYHKYNALAFVISDEVWDSLTEEQQKIVQSAAKTSAQQDVQNAKVRDENAVKRMESVGVKIIYPNRNEFAGQASAIIRGYQNKYGGYAEKLISEYMK